MLDTRSHLFPRSLDALGFDLKTDGFHVVLGRELPGLVRADIKRLVTELLARNGSSGAPSRFSPSTRAEAYPRRRGGPARPAARGDRPLARTSCARHGNLSSATVFFVLNECLSRRTGGRDARPAGAFGPGSRRAGGAAMELTLDPRWTLPAFTGLVCAVGVMRLVELVISQRRRMALRARGAAPVASATSWPWCCLHTGILVASIAEAWMRRPPALPWLALPALACCWGQPAALVGDRHAGAALERADHGLAVAGRGDGGPYRFVRHPNYVAVFVELAAAAAGPRAYLTGRAGAAAHVWVLAQRIRAEDEVLLADPAYRAAMGGKPRFLPRLGLVMAGRRRRRRRSRARAWPARRWPSCWGGPASRCACTSAITSPARRPAPRG
jgi:methyltransferase